MEPREYPDRVEQDYCPLCGGSNVLNLPQPIPVNFRQFVRDLCPSDLSPEDEDWHTVTCACAAFNHWDQPASVSQYARVFNNVTACWLQIATPQQWFEVCVMQSDLPSGDVVQRWAAAFNLSMDQIPW